MAPPASPRPLTDHRLIIVTGKGGTGKTTVSAALALAAAGEGRRVLVAEVARDAQVPRILDPDAAPVGYEPREILPGVAVMRVDPFEALAEYLGLQLRVRSVVNRIVEYPAFRQLLGAAPGWRELITLGKVWHLEQMRDGPRPRYDLLVVDAPATGHGLTFLDVPRVVVSAVRAGPLREHTERVEALIGDAQRTLLIPVALAEELPARETAELVRRVRDELSIHVDRVVVNAVHQAPFPEGLEDLDRRLAALPSELDVGPLSPTLLAACASQLRARHVLNRRYVQEIGRVTGLPVICLPYLRRGIDGADAVGALAARLSGPPEAL